RGRARARASRRRASRAPARRAARGGDPRSVAAQPGAVRSMKRHKILLLAHEDLVPPEDADSLTEEQIEPFRTEHHVLTTLRALGHEVRPVGLDTQLPVLSEAIAEWRPDVVFNLLNEFSGIASYDHYVVAHLELMRQPYTGCNPRG